MHQDVLDNLGTAVSRLKAIRNQAGDVEDLEWVYTNLVGGALVGLSPHELIGLTIRKVTEDYLQGDTAFLDAAIEAINTGERTEVISNPRGNGGAVDNLSLLMTYQPDGDILTLTIQDVTKMAGENVEVGENLRLFREATNGSAIGVAIYDIEARFIYVNPSFGDLLGYEPSELVGRDSRTILRPQDRAGSQSRLEAARKGEINYHSGERIYLHKDGTEIPTSISVSLTVDPITGMKFFVSQVRDVREEQRKARELEALVYEAQKATRLKSEFLANMSHEIRTPLNGVIGMAQVLARSDIGQAHRESVDTILDSGRSLLVLLNDILDLSKMEAGEFDIRPVDWNIRQKLNRIHGLFAPLAADKDLELLLFVDRHVPKRLRFDPDRLRQCLSNLITNAIKFTDTGSIQILATTEPGDDGEHTLKIHVADTGIGVAKDAERSIFESFRQGDGSSTRRHGGTGLGLSISRQLAQGMGGDITVASEAGKGSVFTFTCLTTDPNHTSAEELTQAPAKRSA